jgi:hypothetical protein
MSEYDPALWDTRLKADAELQGLQNLLAPYSVKARGLEDLMPSIIPAKSRYAKFVKLVASGLAASLLLYVAHLYRLDWDEGQPWQASLLSIPEKTVTGLVVAPGSLLETNLQQSLNIEVARIGHIALSPKSKLRLIETQANRHRVELESGHLRATIWAPPGYFGVTDGTSELVDLGCDFDLWKNLDGSGRVYVRSGWIAYRIGAYDVLVPAGYEMKFNAQRPFIPIRPNSNPDFVKSVHQLELVLTKSGASSIAALSASAVVAETAQDADAFTLLSLLTQYPPLAKGELYPRLAIALDVSVNNATHRAAWGAGNMHAMSSWWDAYPTQPKNWLANWTDLLI